MSTARDPTLRFSALHGALLYALTNGLIMAVWWPVAYVRSQQLLDFLETWLWSLGWGAAAGVGVAGIAFAYSLQFDSRFFHIDMRLHRSTRWLLLNLLATGIVMNLVFEWKTLLVDFKIPASIDSRSTDPLSARFFRNGWPFSPCMICPFHGMTFHPEEEFIQIAWLLNAYVLALILVCAAFIIEMVVRRMPASWRGR